MNDKIDREYMIRFFKEPKGPPFPLLVFATDYYSIFCK